MPVLPAPTTTYAGGGCSSDVSAFGGTQCTPSATSYGGGRIDGTTTCEYVASTTFFAWTCCFSPDTSEAMPPSAYSLIGKKATRPLGRNC